jgi:hypothetical protein
LAAAKAPAAVLGRAAPEKPASRSIARQRADLSKPTRRPAVSPTKLRTELRAIVENWRTLLGQGPAVARPVRRQLLTSMIAATPSVNGGYTFTAPTILASLIAAVVPMVAGGGAVLDAQACP